MRRLSSARLRAQFVKFNASLRTRSEKSHLTWALGLGLGLIVATSGCSGTPKKDGEKKEPETGATSPAPTKPVSEALAGSFTGKWTRADGLVFDVTDDGVSLKGTLESDPKATFETFSFTLHREGDGLVGKAAFKEKAGFAGETGWTLHAADGGNLLGDDEVVAVDPDTGEAADFLGRRTEKHPFTVVRPAPPPPPPAPEPKAPEPEAPKAPDAAAPEAPKAPDAPAPEAPKAPDAPAPEAPKAEAPAPAPAPEAPKAEAPAPEAPKAEAPAPAPAPENAQGRSSRTRTRSGA